MSESTPPSSDDQPSEPRRRQKRPASDGSAESRPRQSSRPTPEQKAARQQDAQARAATNERKARTRELIQMGGVAAAFGFNSPQQIEEILMALVRSPKGAERLRGLGVEPTDRWPSG